ncbi:alpha/beta hydrolase family protein [Cohnella pontilimi]|nr:prolyl oligopeptidase family serine peptidase [Cohnella pontilimi]
MYRLTYLSGSFKVKGYLAYPDGFHFHAEDLKDRLRSHFGTGDLPVTELACCIRRETRDIRSHKWPVFIYCRGGIGKVGSVKTDWLEQISTIGRHLVFAPCYRGAEGGEGRDEFGGNDREDVLSAYRFLESLPFVDANRITVMGFSRGAVNAALTAVHMANVRKLVLWGGVSDLAQTYEERIDLRRMLKRVVGGTPVRKPEAFRSRSPLYVADQFKCPVLIMHGTEDVQVDYLHGINMYHKLLENGVNADLHRYEGCGHHLPQAVHVHAIQRMFDWINK